MSESTKFASWAKSIAEQLQFWCGLGPRTPPAIGEFSFIIEIGRDGINNNSIYKNIYNKWRTLSEYDAWWTALKDLCLRGYWKRLWIIQEIGLARDIELCCGHDYVSGDWFYIVLKRVKDSYRKNQLVKKRVRTAFVVN